MQSSGNLSQQADGQELGGDENKRAEGNRQDRQP